MPAHSVSYADRIRPLSPDDPAFVVDSPDGTRALLTQQQACSGAAQLRGEHGVSFESTTYTAVSAGPLALAEFLASATAGAATVIVADPAGPLPDLLAAEEVTHAFLPHPVPPLPGITVIS
jgi:hypothetical protein